MEDKEKILDIAMNLTRIGNWAADGYSAKQKRIVLFLNQTTTYLNSLNLTFLPTALKTQLERLLSEYPELEKEGIVGPKNPLAWAERMMTWGNILTHRCQLLKS